MKKTYITLHCITCLLLGASLYGQSNATKKADKHFQRLEYVAAANEYLKLAEGSNASPYVYKQLAESYYQVFNTAEAAKWYAKAVETEQDAETYYRYAQMLKAQGKHQEAQKQMQKFAAKAPNDQRAKAFKENPNYLNALLSKQQKYEVKEANLNSDKNDFAMVLQQGVGYFTSSRNTQRKTYGWDKQPYTDVYQASFNAQDFTFGTPELTASINAADHDGPVTFSKDGNTMYFASSSFREKAFEKDKTSNSKQGQVHLYKAVKTADGWGGIEPLSINGTNFSTANPCLSADGKTLYFSSNREGGQGGIDIWKAAVNADGSVGEPQNLGKGINTEGDESFPFISADNKTLYFASNGRQGFGGYDVFVYDMTKQEATNLGKPVNSEQDDFAFSFYTTENVGFVSSNRAGVDNIYVVTPICGVEITTVVTNAKTGAVLSNAKVTLVDAKKNILETAITNAKGEVAFYVACNQAFSVQAQSEGFDPGAFEVAASKGPTAKVDAKLNPIEVIITETQVILNPIFFEFNQSNITEQGAAELDKLVKVMNDNPNMVIFAKSHTDNRGSDAYNLRLSDRRAKSTVAYIISKGIAKERISGKGFGETEPIVDCKENCTEEEHAQNRRSEFMIVKK